MRPTFIFAIAATIFSAGCASFEADRSSKFIDEDNYTITVEYAKGEEHETSFTTPTGVTLPFKSRLMVRVTLPDGTRFMAYQNMSTAGVLYKSEDEAWEYFEEGTGCAVAHLRGNGDGYYLVFQGVLCMNGRNVMKKPKITGSASSSTPHGFGRDSKGPRESSGPRTVEQNDRKD